MSLLEPFGRRPVPQGMAPEVQAVEVSYRHLHTINSDVVGCGLMPVFDGREALVVPQIRHRAEAIGQENGGAGDHGAPETAGGELLDQLGQGLAGADELRMEELADYDIGLRGGARVGRPGDGYGSRHKHG